MDPDEFAAAQVDSRQASGAQTTLLSLRPFRSLKGLQLSDQQKRFREQTTGGETIFPPSRAVHPLQRLRLSDQQNCLSRLSPARHQLRNLVDRNRVP